MTLIELLQIEIEPCSNTSRAICVYYWIFNNTHGFAATQLIKINKLIMRMDYDIT